MTRALVIAAALALCAPGCKRGSDPGGGKASGTGGVIAGPCAEVAGAVRELYRSESTGNPELDADVLEANVHMVLADCSSDPDRFAPCIRRAGSVAALERDCLIPLDDEGASEGRQFGQ